MGMPIDRAALRAQLIRHEGMVLLPYEDSVGKITIGVGRNLDDRGISRSEALLLLENDINAVLEELALRDWARGHDAVRTQVLVNMAFNLGLPRLEGFKRMIAALRAQDYAQAAREMLDSKWARQVGVRAEELAEQMERGA